MVFSIHNVSGQKRSHTSASGSYRKQPFSSWLSMGLAFTQVVHLSSFSGKILPDTAF